MFNGGSSPHHASGASAGIEIEKKWLIFMTVFFGDNYCINSEKTATDDVSCFARKA